MKLEVPKEFGYMINRTTNKRNIIFASDNHSSLQSLMNNAKLYLHLLGQFNLSMVGIESYPYKEIIPNTKPKLELEHIYQTINTIEDKIEQDSRISNLGFLIRYMAYGLGKELIIPSSGESDYAELLSTIYKHYHLNQQGKNRDEDKSRDEMRINEIIKSHPLKDKLQSLFIEALRRPTTKQLISACTLVRSLRTEACISALDEEMETSNKDVALLTRGIDHVGEFINQVVKRDIGFAIFVPNGILNSNPKVFEAYKKSLFKMN